MGDFDLNEIQQSINPKKEKKSSKAFLKKILKIIIVVVPILIVGLATNYIFSLKYRNRDEVINIGYVEQESVVLFTIADELKYFDDAGIPVELRKFKNEEDLIKAWDKGKLDLLVLEDIGFVLNTGSFKSSRVISTVARYDTYKYIVDLKKSIYKISDLNSKTIGVEDDDNSTFWLESGLQNSGVNRQTINIVHFKPKDLGEELANGFVDAVFAKNLDAYNALKFSNTEIQSLGLSAQGEKKANALLVATDDYIEDQDTELNQVLTALVTAKDYYDNNKESVSNILIAKWSVEKGYVTEITKSYNYDLVLDSKLTELMISEVTWARSRGKIKEVVDIKPLINYNLLRKIKPENVTF